MVELSGLVEETVELSTLNRLVFVELGLEHEVMTQFVDEVDDLVQQPPHRENSLLHDSRINTSTPNPPPYDDDSVSLLRAQ